VGGVRGAAHTNASLCKFKLITPFDNLLLTSLCSSAAVLVLAKRLRASLRNRVSRSALTYCRTAVQEALAAESEAEIVGESKAEEMVEEEEEESEERDELSEEVLARRLRVKKLLRELVNLLIC
jgi:hypothetical protein